jgi:hypothetical protein
MALISSLSIQTSAKGRGQMCKWQHSRLRMEVNDLCAMVMQGRRQLLSRFEVGDPLPRASRTAVACHLIHR